MTERTIKPKLPATLGEFLGECLDDLEKIERLPGYKIHMDFWHHYNERKDTCYVCLAGCRLAGWGIDREEDVFDVMGLLAASDEHTAVAHLQNWRVLRSVDYCQKYAWEIALGVFYNKKTIPDEHHRDVEIEIAEQIGGNADRYRVNPENFKRNMRVGEAVLKRHGL